jgi:ABC-type amino acid transport substrate-binding protein
VVKQKIRVATDANRLPFESKDPSGQEIVGFDIDLTDAVAKKAGLEVEYVPMGFDQITAELAECKIDAAIPLIAVTEKRKASMLFSDPYFQLGQLLVVRTENTDIVGADSLSGKQVGAQIGTAGAIEIGKIKGVRVRSNRSQEYRRLSPERIAALRPPRKRAGRAEHVFVAPDEVLQIAGLRVSEDDLATRRDQAAAAMLFLSGMRSGAFTTLPLEAADIEGMPPKPR